MSRSFSFSLSFCFSNVITNKISHAIARRGYAYAASASRGELSSMARVGAPKKGSDESAWVPDPKTGYYRPENHAKDDDHIHDANAKTKTKTKRELGN